MWRFGSKEDLEIAKRQVSYLYGDTLVSHFDFIFFISFSIHFDFPFILGIICILGVHIGGHTLDCWLFCSSSMELVFFSYIHFLHLDCLRNCFISELLKIKNLHDLFYIMKVGEIMISIWFSNIGTFCLNMDEVYIK